MIESIRGVVESCSHDTAVVRLGGLSLRLGVTTETGSRLRPGEQAELFTHLYLREEIVALYGFATQEERTLFEELMGVSGVGPRAALGFLSTFSPGALREAIEHEDLVRLTRVPGVGKKTAQRVVLELKGKLSRIEGVATAGPLAARDQELVSVLMNWGYSAVEAAEALRSSDVAAASTDEDRIRAALRYFTAT